ncbi:MAG: DUF4399 domain-containing protein [Dehalococcoidia bacterium]|jgi:hypothetical protein
MKKVVWNLGKLCLAVTALLLIIPAAACTSGYTEPAPAAPVPAKPAPAEPVPVVPAPVETAPAAPVAAAPTIVIVSPANGATLPGGNVTVTVQVSNFNLVDKLGTANVAGQGHIHYFMDVDAPTKPGAPAVTSPGTYAATASTTHTWPSPTPGTHTFSVELINNDHSPLQPPVVSKVTVKVSAPVSGY